VVVPIPTFLFASTIKPVPPTLRSEAERLVEEAVVAKKLVVVAEVPVALTKVKFWRVEDPERSRLERVVSPPVAVSVPVKFAVDEIVWPLIKPEVIVPEVIFPRTEFPAVKLVVKRLVEEAVVAKELVEVAAVVVERVMLLKMFAPVKVLLFERSVEEAAVIVMSAEPSKEMPLMFLAVSRIVAVPAFPETEPVMI
jgi:hypothetical protein